MATIPQLERRNVRAQTGIARVDARGAASLGQHIASGITEVKDTRDRYQLADAASKFSILKHQQDNAFDEEDLDYGTYEERYSKNMDDGLGEIAEGISDPQLRNMFMLDNKPRVVAGQERIRDKAFAVETDVQRANINSRMNGLREVILGDDETESIRAIQDTKDLLASARDSGYYGAEEMGNMERAFAADAAMGYVDNQPLEDQMGALNSDVVKENVPSDVIAIKKRSIEKGTLIAEAQKIAAGMDGMTEIEQKKAMREYRGEGMLYEHIKQQVNDINVENKKIQLADDEALHNDWYLKVVRQEEGYQLKDLMNPDNKEFIGIKKTGYQEHLLNAARAVNKPRTKSNAKVIDTLHRLNSEEKYEELRKFFLNNIGNLSAAHIDTWSKTSNEGIIPEEYKSQFSLIQRVDNKLASNDIKDVKMALQVRDKVDEWNKRYFKNSGDSPNDKEMDSEIDRIISEVSISRFGNEPVTDVFTAESTVLDLSPEELDELTTDTIENPQGATRENLEFVINDVFSRTDDPEMVQQTIDVAVDRFEELTEETQESVFDMIRLNNTEIFDRLGTDFLNANGRMPEQQDIITGYKYVRDYLDQQSR